jgi:drug/metabolite transporter (DMT)-like permease
MFVNRHVFLRTFFDFVGTLLFITALTHMQIANLTAINQTVPLAVTTLSALILGERIGAARIAAIIIGFAAVLIIVRPNPTTLSLYDGIGFSVVFTIAARDLATRKIPRSIPTLVVALANAALIALGGWLTVALQGFVTPAVWQLALMAFAAVFLALGYMLMVATLRLGDISASAPFRYSVMVFALIAGMVVFHEFPDGWAILGMAMIVATGLVMARREARLQK